MNGINLDILLRWLFTTPIQFGVGGRFYVAAWKALSHRSANMDVLVVLGTSVSYFYSVLVIVLNIFLPAYQPIVFFETSSMLITFILLGKYLEYVAKGKTCDAIGKLIALKVRKRNPGSSRANYTFVLSPRRPSCLRCRMDSL